MDSSNTYLIERVKQWICSLRSVRKIHPDTIIVRCNQENTIITLLDVACCVPAIVLNKPIEAVEMDDIRAFIHKINHQH